MLVLFETPAGYAIFKLLDENKLTESENLYKDFQTPEDASKIIKLRHFHKFEDTTEALAATTALVESRLSKSLKKTLKNCKATEVHEQLAVADAKLGCVIKDKLQLSCITNTAVQELIRCIRSQMHSLVTDVTTKEMSAMALGLAHSLSRYKLKFSPDKIDTMVIQGVCLLDDLDKELNNYIMRAREWYGWHFPELGRIVNDNIQYVKTMMLIGQRENAKNCELSDILTEEIEERVKEAAETSMGSEISEYDAEHMQYLCNEILELHRYRSNLSDYLNSRMLTLAPNLSVLVGELVGARLISKAGSLRNLAKHPASTLQILGAEKALFRALKSRKKTPKYGLIYHSQLVGQSSNKNKGKISRMLAAKASLATRVDALGNPSNCDLGTQHKAKLEARLRQLEEGNIRRISGTAKAKAKFEKYHSKNEYKQYSATVDSTLPNKKPLIEEIDTKESEEMHKKRSLIEEFDTKEGEEMRKKKRTLIEEIDTKESEKAPKKKKKKKHSLEPMQEEGETSGVQQEVQVKTETDSTSKKKKKRSTQLESKEGEASGVQEVKTESQVETEIQVKTELDSTSKKKKKRSKQLELEDKEAKASGMQEEVQMKTEMDTASKKKKRHGTEIESEDKEELQISSKKKKKRSTDHKTEDAGEASGMQEAQAETDLNISKKKKKKKV